MALDHVQALEQRNLFAYDLAMTALVPVSQQVVQGGTLSAVTTVTNHGDTTFAGGSVYFAFTDRRVGVATPDGHTNVIGQFGKVSLIPLAPGETTDVTLTLPVAARFPLGLQFFSAVATERTDDIADPNAEDIDFEQNDAFGDDNSLSATNKVAVTAAPVQNAGRPDTGFGTGGAAATTVPRKLDVADTVYDSSTSLEYAAVTVRTENGPILAVLRLLSTGAVDTTYGGGDGVLLPGGPAAQAKSITKLGDGSFMLTAMTPDANVVLVRLGFDGMPVPQFGTNGIVVLSPQASKGLTNVDISAVTSGSDHTAYLVGTSGPKEARRITVLKLMGSGQPDDTFGTGGVAYPASLVGSRDTARAAMFLPDGRMVIAGQTQSLDGTFASLAVVLTPTGQPDMTFGTAGRYETLRGPGRSTFSAVATDTAGLIYLGGAAVTTDAGGSTLVAVKLLGNGKPAPKFANLGLDLIPIGTTYSIAASVIPTADGGMLLSARTATAAGALAKDNVGISLIRIQSTGVLLSTFGTAGILVVKAPPIVTSAASSDDLDSFTSSSTGQAESVEGGKVRLLAATTNDDSSTTLTATQIVADGVDLTGSTTATVSGTVLNGKSSTLKVTVSNQGTLALNGKAVVTVKLLSSLDDTTGITATATTSALKLAAGSSKALTLKFKYPTLSTTGRYYIAADVAPPSGITDIDSSNDRAVASGIVKAGPAFTDVTFALKEPLTLPAAGKSGTISVTVANAGNTIASGALLAELFLTDGTDSDLTSLGTISAKASIKAGGSSILKLKATLPAGTVVPAGKYLAVQFSGVLVALDEDLTDNTTITNAVVS